MGKVKKSKRIFTSLLLILMMFNILGVGISSDVNERNIQAERVVYITRTGSKYHTHKCGNGTYYRSTLSIAKSRGLDPCKKCFPYGEPSSSNSTNKKSSSTSRKENISINTTSIVLIKGQTYQLKIRGTSKNIKWTTNNRSVAIVNSKGKVTAVNKGNTVIEAKIGSITKKCNIVVETPQLNETSIVLEINKTKNIKVIGCSHHVKWKSSNSSVVSVKNGKVTAKKAGNTTISATIHNKKYECKVKVEKPEVNSISLNSTEITMKCKSTKVLSLNAKPSNVLDYYKVTAISSNNKVVTVKKIKSGKIYIESHEEGTATIEVTVNSKKVLCTVTVKKPEITSITLSKESLIIEPGASSSISYKTTPSDIEDNYNIEWKSSNESIVKIESITGKYVYLRAGTIEGEANITLTIGNKSVTCKVSVKKPEIASLSLNKSSLSLNVGESSTINYVIAPFNIEKYYTIQWKSSNEDIIKVESISGKNAYLKAGKVEGEAYISLTIGNKTAICKVSVKKPEITSLTLNKSSISLKSGESSTLSYSITPYGVENNYEVQWKSSNEDIVKVEGISGRYVYIKAGKVEGEAQVTLTIGNKTAICKVSVKKPEITSLTLSTSSISLKSGESSTLSYSITPYGVENNYEVQWKSSNEDIVKVESISGRYVYIKAGKVEGEAQVTLTIGNKTASCKVSVKRPEITSLTLSKSAILLKSGESSTLSYSIAPYRVDNYYEVEWKSSNDDIVRIEKTNESDVYLIAGTVEGEADVTLRIGNKAAICKVSVKQPELTSVSFNQTSLEVEQGAATTLSYVIEPNGVENNYIVQCKSSNEEIVQIEKVSEGVVYIKAGMVEGEAEVILSIGKLTSTCKIYVKKSEVISAIFD